MIDIPNSHPLSFQLPDKADQTALLLIDFQGDFCDEKNSFLEAVGAGDGAKLTSAVLPTAQRLLAAARKANIHIIHTLESHLTDLTDLTSSKDGRSRNPGTPDIPVIGQEGGNGRIFVRGSPCNGLMPEVAFRDGEVAIHKPGKGSFCDTEMRARLEGVSHLIFCGVTTEVCVATTMREANDRGFQSILVEDATASCIPAFKTEAIGQLTAFGGIVACSASANHVIAALDKLSSTSLPANVGTNHQSNDQSLATQLPVIDVSPLVNRLNEPFAAARRAVDPECLQCAKEIDRACREVGFFYVTGHDFQVDPPLSDAKHLFTMDVESKLKLKAAAGEGAGYEPSGAQVLDEGRLGDGIDGQILLGDRKESYIIGKSAPSQRVDHSDRIEGRWPDEQDALFGFRERLIAYHDNAESFLRTLLRGVALGLGMAADTFDCFTKDAMTKVRLLRYPAPDKDATGYASAHGCGAHCDWGALTLLAQDQVGGLEVCTSDKEWVAAPNIDGALLINVGDMLQMWTGGRYRSAPHRVVRPLKQSEDRFSVAVFYNCDHDAPIDPRLLMPNKEVDLGEDFKMRTAEEYILERVNGTYVE